MSTIKTINLPDGSQAKAQDMGFTIRQEHWSEYELSDGTSVRVRTTVLRILQVLDDQGKPARTPEGDPFLIVSSRADVIASG